MSICYTIFKFHKNSKIRIDLNCRHALPTDEVCSTNEWLEILVADFFTQKGKFCPTFSHSITITFPLSQARAEKISELGSNLLSDRNAESVKKECIIYACNC